MQDRQLAFCASGVVLFQQTALCLFCLMLMAAAPVALASDATRFDTLIQQLDNGELVFTDRAAIDDFVRQLKETAPAKDEKRQLRLKRELCTVDFFDTPDQGIIYANQFLHNPALSQDMVSLTYFYLCRAYHHGSKNQLVEQDADLRQALALSARSEDPLAKAQALSGYADLRSSRGEHAEALMSLFEAHQLYKKLGNRFGIGSSVENIAISFRRMGEYDKAIEYLELSEKEFAAPGDKYRLGFLLQQKAFVYGEIGKPEVAKELLQRVRQLYIQIGEPVYATATEVDQMWIANQQERYSESLELAKRIKLQLLQYQQQGGGQKAVNEELFALYQAEALAGTGQIKAALEMFIEAEKLISALDNPRYSMWLHRAWSKALARAGDYQQAYQQLLQANALESELNSLAKKQQESLLRYQFDTELKDEKNSQLKAENQLTAQQVQVLESAQRWQYIAIALFIILALIALFYAISQIQRNRQLHRLAMTDELTQVANRRSVLWFAAQVRQQAQDSQQSWCLLLIDIDYFKQCNDNYGHDAGDEVLVHIAAALKNLIRPLDRLGRTGGEEFLLVLPQTELPSATEVAERLRSCVESLQFAAYPALRISISIGVAQAGRQEDVREVMSRADAALYQAKANGRNRVIVT